MAVIESVCAFAMRRNRRGSGPTSVREPIRGIRYFRGLVEPNAHPHGNRGVPERPEGETGRCRRPEAPNDRSLFAGTSFGFQMDLIQGFSEFGS
ncbi:hypothetical protein SCOR_11035 [Sulfidibacter corallicola]